MVNLTDEQRTAIGKALREHPKYAGRQIDDAFCRTVADEIKAQVGVNCDLTAIRRVFSGGYINNDTPMKRGAPSQGRVIAALFRMHSLDLDAVVSGATAPTYETHPHLFFPDVQSFGGLRGTRISECVKMGPIQHLINYCHKAKEKKWPGHEIDAMRFLEAAAKSQTLRDNTPTENAAPSAPKPSASPISVTTGPAGFSISKIKAAVTALKEANLYTPELKVGILRELGLE